MEHCHSCGNKIVEGDLVEELDGRTVHFSCYRREIDSNYDAMSLVEYREWKSARRKWVQLEMFK